MSDVGFKEKLQDALWRTETRWQDECTDFIPRVMVAECESLLRASPVCWHVWGGWNEAERVRLFLTMSEEAPGPDDFQMTVLRATGQMRFVRVTHRDYLGALMSLGFVREKMGDLIVRDDGCDVLVVKELADFICRSEISVKRVPLTFKQVPYSEWIPPILREKELKIFVNQPRLDAVVAHGFGLSRKEAANRILAGDVVLSYRETKNVSASVATSDLISVRHLGKLRIGDIAGSTKKGRICLLVYKYL